MEEPELNYDVWKAAAVMNSTMLRYQNSPLMKEIGNHQKFHRIADCMARGGIPTLGAASLSSDKRLLDIRGMTVDDVRAVRVVCFYLNGQGEKWMVDSERRHLESSLDLLRRQEEVLQERIKVMEKRLKKLRIIAPKDRP